MNYEEMEVLEKSLVEIRPVETKGSVNSNLLETSKLVPLFELLKFFVSEEDRHLAPRSRRGHLKLTRNGAQPATLTTHKFQEILTHKKIHGGHIVEVMLHKRVATEEEIVLELTSSFGFPFLPLSSYDISAEAISVVPASTAIEHLLIPIDKIQSSLMVAMANPLDTHAIKEVESLTNCHVQVFISKASDIRHAIEKYYRRQKLFSDPLLQ
jgi:hypothetical protein